MSQGLGGVEGRASAIKSMLAKLHEGASVEQVKQEFEEKLGSATASEISEAEQRLISEGMPVAEVQKLCDVHSAVFKGSIEDIHAEEALEGDTPGHPAHTLKAENRALESFISDQLRPKMAAVSAGSAPVSELVELVETLWQLDRHYERKEQLFFPYMEQHGITAPPQVMWGVDDEIRALIKDARALVAKGDSAAVAKLEETLVRVEEMIFKEDNILLPMVFDAFTDEEWMSIAEGSDELGYLLIDTPPAWKHEGTSEPAASVNVSAGEEDGLITLPTGKVSVKELTLFLNALPIDITFVGADDKVRYFSESPERIFARTKAIIGREVTNCHPPDSVHVVESIVNDFKSGKKSSEEFWIPLGEMYVYIRYFAVRDADGTYMGTLEVSQNIKPIQAITGSKRILDAE